ncbi:hypothetical protein CR513_47809, partial [Mucuna pruriens]
MHAETISAKEDQEQAKAESISDNKSENCVPFRSDFKESATVAKGRNHVGTLGAESNSSRPTGSESISRQFFITATTHGIKAISKTPEIRLSRY